MFWLIVRRDMRLAWRQRIDILHPLWFFLLVMALFALGVGPDPELLRRIAPGIVWVAALLAALLSLESLFGEDFRDGSLEQILLMPLPLPAAVLAKICAHWLAAGVPLIVLSPLAAVLFSLDFATWRAVALTLLLGTPTLSLLGAIGAGLTVGLHKGGALLSLLLLPLFIPVLIFAAAAIDDAAQGLDISGNLAMLGALLVLSLMTAPFAAAAALRVTLQ
ncbi:heme exporter protein CcmB [Martelella alba]|uniref:Heme exporter protein B n=1 Tax=Martelella alba TaxID=2590451 RepID=A0ABY2SH05_9HYPH|nr:heme exporter protein CcmB [Martelella alba]TKI03867.1 heme exporter protein CcmB [Martelella alba]